MIDNFETQDLYTADDYDDSLRFGEYPVNDRYRISGYCDSAFGVDDKMRSMSGLLVLINGGPLDWAALKESLVVDSTTASESLCYSSLIKRMKYSELRFKFFRIQPPKPYDMYTDSTAGKLLACNPNKLGRVRHLAFRTHLIKCYIQIGDIRLIYCVTEAMLADCLTKICDAAQRKNLGLRFYNDCIFDDGRFYQTPCYERSCRVEIFDPNSTDFGSTS